MTAKTSVNNHHKYLALFEEPYVGGVPTTISSAVRINDDLSWQDDSQPVQRRNVAGSTYSHRHSLPGRGDASGKVPFNLAPPISAGTAPAEKMLFEASGFTLQGLTMLKCSGTPAGLGAGDVVDDAASTPTASALVALVVGSKVYCVPTAGSFSAGDTLYKDGVSLAVTVSADPMDDAAWDISLDSSAKRQICAMIFTEKTVDVLRLAAGSFTLSAGESFGVLVASFDLSGVRDKTLSGEASQEPVVTFLASEQDLQFKQVEWSVVDEVGSPIDLVTDKIGLRGFELTASMRKTALPDATADEGFRGMVVNGRDDVSVKLTIDEPRKTTWDVAKAKQNQTRYNVAMLVGGLFHVSIGGQVSGLTYGDDNGFATAELTLDLTNNDDADTELSMVLISDEAASA